MHTMHLFTLYVIQCLSEKRGNHVGFPENMLLYDGVVDSRKNRKETFEVVIRNVL